MNLAYPTVICVIRVTPHLQPTQMGAGLRELSGSHDTRSTTTAVPYASTSVIISESSVAS